MPKVIVVEQPAPVLKLDVVKKHLRIDHADEDDLLQTYVAAATEEIDGPEGWLGLSLGEQLLEWQGDGFPSDRAFGIRLPCPPVMSLESVAYTDPEGVSQTLPGCELHGQDLFPAQGGHWPSALCRPGSVRIRYRAGHDGEEGRHLATPIIQALLIMVEDFWERRASDGPMHPTAARLLSPRRIWS